MRLKCSGPFYTILLKNRKKAATELPSAHYVSIALDCVLCLSSFSSLKLHIQSLNKRQVDCHINQNQYELK